MNTKEKILKLPNFTIKTQKEDESCSQIDKIVRSLKTQLSRGLLVPLICEDMFEFADPKSGETQSLHEYIVEQVIGQCESTLSISENELDDILTKGYYGIQLLQDRIGRNIYDPIYDAVMDISIPQIGIRLKPQVKEFLESWQFPLIITTNCFPIIENTLEGYHSEFNKLEIRNENPITPKCVYHLFGEAMPNADNWGYDEKQILKFLKKAYSSDYKLSNLYAYLTTNNSKKSLLILGNDTPNWLFRFILSPIYPGEDVYDSGNGFYMTENMQEEDRCLTHFLHMINFKRDNKIMDILEAVTNKNRGRNPNPIAESENEYDIFISHASEDNETVRKLVDCLEAKGVKREKIWVDYDSIHKGPYWESIINGMRKAKYFMPLITKAYMEKTQSKEDQEKVLQELNINTILFDSKQTHDIDNKIGGVATELILAKRLFTGKQSLPVILSNSYFPTGELLTSTRIDNWGHNSILLPESLFYGISMFEFNDSAPEKLNLDWNKIVTNRSYE